MTTFMTQCTNYSHFSILASISVKGLGFETWAATGKELLCFGIADFVIFIEQAKAAGSSSLNELFRSMNKDSVSAHMPPGQLWLDAETIEAIVKSLSAPPHGNAYGRRRRLNSSSFVKRIPQNFPNCRGLRSVRIPLPSGDHWDLERLEGVMKRVLFPSAALSNTCPHEQWITPPNDRGLYGMARSIELAKVKVFATRQTEIGRTLFSEYVTALLDTPVAASLRSGVLSVHASLSSKGSREASILLEASAGAVIIRKCTTGGDMTTSKSSRNVLCVQGVFSDKELDVLNEVLANCTPYCLPEKEAKTVADLSADEKSFIQKSNSELAVPEGWWFDGSSFVDMHGRRSLDRPDTDQLQDLFVKQQNEDTAKCNQLLAGVKEFL
jgi:hypothetical protein